MANEFSRLELDERDPDLEALKDKIHLRSGFNCHFYKDKCLHRRLGVRMRARGLESYTEYSELLDREPTEYDVLVETLTINVSKFFRNPEIWSAIERDVVPRLFAGERRPRRIWSAGCAAGEEPYSLSILLREWASANGREDELDDFTIIGTDIDRRILEAARRAEYSQLSMTDISPERLQRWFTTGPPYQLSREAKMNVEFILSDLISSEPPRDLSLIVCRNVIIYFSRDIQEKIFERFYEALLPGGCLVLGKVETLLGRPRSLFLPVSQRERVFRKPG